MSAPEVNAVVVKDENNEIVSTVTVNTGVRGLEGPAGPTGVAVESSQHSADYTLALEDAGTVVEMTSDSAVSLTVPTHADVAFDVGTVVEVFQYGEGQVTISPAEGVTLRSDQGLSKVGAQYGTVGLRCRAEDEWVLSGDLT